MDVDDRERWNSRYRDQAARLAADGSSGGDEKHDGRFAPPSALLRLATHLPLQGAAIDLAGGTGGAALHYATEGLQAVLIDVSDEALAQAADQAARAGLDLRTVRMDLEGRTLGDLLNEIAGQHPDLAPVSVVSCFHYLQRTLLGSVLADLPSGAVFLAAIATRTNLERNDRPSARFLLEPGELERLVLAGESGDRTAVDGTRSLRIRHNSEGWNDGDHHEAELVVQAGSGLP